jgi:hypothetical protein
MAEVLQPDKVMTTQEKWTVMSCHCVATNGGNESTWGWGENEVVNVS